MTSATGEGIRKGNDKTTWRGVVMQNFKYCYDLKNVYNDHAVYRQKVTGRV